MCLATLTATARPAVEGGRCQWQCDEALTELDGRLRFATFVRKDALLLLVWPGETPRPTSEADLL